MLTLTLLLLAAVHAAGQAQETVNVTAIELVAEVKSKDGQVPADLAAADFTVLEDGVAQKVIGVDYLGVSRSAPAAAEPVAAAKPTQEPAPEPPPLWHFVFYFESELSSAAGRKQVAESIGAQADDLVRRGKVDIVFATPIPVALLRDSRDPKAIREALGKIARHPGNNQLLQNRRRFRDEMIARGGRELEFNDLRPYLEEDMVMLMRFRRNLSRWLTGYRRHSPRMAVVVTDGFDLEPINYYAAEAVSLLPEKPFLAAELRAMASGMEMGLATSALAKEMAGGSWVITSVPAQMDMGMTVDDATTSGRGRVKSAIAKPIGVKAMVSQATAPLTMLAEATGGTVVGNYSKFGEALEHLNRYVKITYQVSRPPDGKIRKVEVRTRRGGLDVRAQQWVSALTPEDTSEARAVALLDGTEYAGQELPVEATLTLDGSTGTIELSADLDALSALIEESSFRTFRVTVAMRQGTNVRYFTRMARGDVSEGELRFRFRFELPEPVTKMILTVEDLATGAWGSAEVLPQ